MIPFGQNRKFAIPGVVVFDTTGLNGGLLKRIDCGGPIALFRLRGSWRHGFVTDVAIGAQGVIW
jgi:hypothetical protein